MPETLPEVDEALMLLGNLIQCLQAGGKFRDSRRAKVQLLVGSVPELATARAWKAGLKELRAELAELEARA